MTMETASRKRDRSGRSGRIGRHLEVLGVKGAAGTVKALGSLDNGVDVGLVDLSTDLISKVSGGADGRDEETPKNGKRKEIPNIAPTII